MASTAPDNTAAPDVHIPPSTNTVTVSIIDTSMALSRITSAEFFGPPLPQHKYMAGRTAEDAIPSFSFLIQHPHLKRNLLFDLGLRKDWQTACQPQLLAALKHLGWGCEVKTDVREILETHQNEVGVGPEDIEAIIWSHFHFDHSGDASRFPAETAVIVGPGVKDKLLPGYPENPESPIIAKDLEGRDLIEVDFGGNGAENLKDGQQWSTLQIGQLRAVDYFHDGSFYLLDTPGHAIGHMVGLARMTEDSFILMGGDAVHHVGELRPSRYLRVPDSVSLPVSSSVGGSAHGCACHAVSRATFEKLLPKSIPGLTSFYAPQGTWHHDAAEAGRSAARLQDLDGLDNVFTVVAHDPTVLGVVDLFPLTANAWKEKGWREKALWRFLGHFDVQDDEAGSKH